MTQGKARSERVEIMMDTMIDLDPKSVYYIPDPPISLLGCILMAIGANLQIMVYQSPILTTDGWKIELQHLLRLLILHCFIENGQIFLTDKMRCVWLMISKHWKRKSLFSLLNTEEKKELRVNILVYSFMILIKCKVFYEHHILQFILH